MLLFYLIDDNDKSYNSIRLDQVNEIVKCLEERIEYHLMLSEITILSEINQYSWTVVKWLLLPLE